VAAEEMERMRGYWWSPDGDALLVARVDESPVQRWHIADPAHPDRAPTEVAYPAAGTPNAAVATEIIALDGTRTPVTWDDEYLADVVWDSRGLLVVTQPRDQTALRTRSVDLATGATTLVDERADPVWVDIVPGVPAHTESGALVTLADVEDARRLVVGGSVVTPASLQVRGVLDVDGDTVLFRASEEPSSVGLWTWGPGGLAALTPEPGVHSGRLRGGTLIVTRAGLDADGSTTTVRHAADAGPDDAAARVGAELPIPSFAEPSGLETRITLLTAGGLPTALLLPSWYEPGTTLPVLMDPYGGPHTQRVVAARGGHLTSQWFAEQGFAVVVVDGRGTPGQGPAFERAVHGDLASPVLDDQVAALQALAADHPDLDLTRVGIRGWSFGGYLAGAAPARHLPRRDRGRARHRLVALRHPLHRALPRPAGLGRLPALVPDRGRPEADPPVTPGARPRRRQRGGRPHAAALVRAPRCRTAAQRPTALGRHPHDAPGDRGGKPPTAAGAVPAGQPALTLRPTRRLMCPRRAPRAHGPDPTPPPPAWRVPRATRWRSRRGLGDVGPRATPRCRSAARSAAHPRPRPPWSPARCATVARAARVLHPVGAAEARNTGDPVRVETEPGAAPHELHQVPG